MESFLNLAQRLDMLEERILEFERLIFKKYLDIEEINIKISKLEKKKEKINQEIKALHNEIIKDIKGSKCQLA